MIRIRKHCRVCFGEHATLLWPTLSRTVSLLAVLNTSLFFLTGAVTTGGYHWPVISLCFLGLVELMLLLPLGLHGRLWFYLALVGLTLTSGGFFLGSVAYWLRTAGH